MSLSNNYLVTRSEFNTMGFVPISGTPTGTNQIVTKAWADANYYVEQNISPYNTYTSNRCPRYQDFFPAYNYWLADEYQCDGAGSCYITAYSQLVAFPANFTPLRTRFYLSSLPGIAHKPIDPTTYGSPAVIMGTTAYINCAAILGC